MCTPAPPCANIRGPPPQGGCLVCQASNRRSSSHVAAPQPGTAAQGALSAAGHRSKRLPNAPTYVAAALQKCYLLLCCDSQAWSSPRGMHVLIRTWCTAEPQQSPLPWLAAAHAQLKKAGGEDLCTACAPGRSYCCSQKRRSFQPCHSGTVPCNKR